jgi:hypothetical protein
VPVLPVLASRPKLSMPAGHFKHHDMPRNAHSWLTGLSLSRSVDQVPKHDLHHPTPPFNRSVHVPISVYTTPPRECLSSNVSFASMDKGNDNQKTA